jgi:hypothetical protein
MIRQSYSTQQAHKPPNWPLNLWVRKRVGIDQQLIFELMRWSSPVNQAVIGNCV